MSELLLAAVVGAFAAGYAAGSHRDRDTRDGIEQYLDDREVELRERYQTTDMDYVTFGDEVALLEDPDTERIMRTAVDVDGIGPATAFELARAFDGYQEFAAAGLEEYEQVNRVGEQKGRALSRRV